MYIEAEGSGLEGKCTDEYRLYLEFSLLTASDQMIPEIRRLIAPGCWNMLEFLG